MVEGLFLDGRHFDCGNTEGYIDAIIQKSSNVI